MSDSNIDSTLKELVLPERTGPKLIHEVTRLNTELESHVGQLVLMVERDMHFDGCAGAGHEPSLSEHSLHTSIYLGVISGPRLLFSDEYGGLELPTGGKCAGQSDTTPLFEHNIRIGITENLLNRDRPMSELEEYDSSFIPPPNPPRLEIIVGDMEVLVWNSTKGAGAGVELGTFCRMVELVRGKLPKLLGDLLRIANEEQHTAIALELLVMLTGSVKERYRDLMLEQLRKARELGFTSGQTLEVMVNIFRKNALSELLSLGAPI